MTNANDAQDKHLKATYDKVDDTIKEMTHAEMAIFIQAFSNALLNLWKEFDCKPDTVLGRHPGTKFLAGLTAYRKLLKLQAKGRI